MLWLARSIGRRDVSPGGLGGMIVAVIVAGLSVLGMV